MSYSACALKAHSGVLHRAADAELRRDPAEDVELDALGGRLGGVLEDRGVAGRAACNGLVELRAFEIVGVGREVGGEPAEQRRLDARLVVLDHLGVDDRAAARGILARAGLKAFRVGVVEHHVGRGLP